MEFSQLKELLTQFDESSIRVLDVTMQETHLFLSKDKQEVPVLNQTSEKIIPTTSAIKNEVEAVLNVADTIEDSISLKEGQLIDSPLVGVVYLSASPEQEVFKKVGDHVAKGEVLCIVEAMKVMNEITSNVEGILEEVLIKNEEVVEYGQPLFRIN